MKIGVDIRVLMDRNYSGISEYTANLLSAILNIDKTNEYKLFYNSYQNIGERLKIWERDNAKIFKTRFPNKIFNYLLQKNFSWPKIDGVLGGTDIFWSPHFNFTSVSSKTKKIITVHDLSFLRYPEFFSFRKNFWHRALRVVKTLKQANLIIAVSENTKNDIIELAGIDSAKVVVVYSGNNLQKKEINDEEAIPFLQKNKINSSFILYLGNIEPRKNIANLIIAFNKLKAADEKYKGLQLVLAGAKAWKCSQIMKEWQKSPYQSNIIFLGYIDKSEKEILYSRAAAFVYPSFYEGFGFPPLEAMAYGVPIICSNVSSLPEVVAEAAILINPFKPEEITSALEIILSNETVRNNLINLGYRREKEFTWEKTAQAYLDIFKKINDQPEAEK